MVEIHSTEALYIGRAEFRRSITMKFLKKNMA
jgi:hypothetical protein